MFLGLALFWILLNGRFSWEILGFGVAFSAALYAFACKYLGFSPREDRRALFFLPYLLPYFGLLLWELIRASFRVMGAILRPGYRPGSRFVELSPPLHSRETRYLLATTLSLCPGTVTAVLRDGRFSVPILDERFGKKLNDGRFASLLRRWEIRIGKREGKGDA